ncbi:hypothetical protein BDB00DRAFT_878005 [Zychaea mexicana]|uniref:uncharacterized protein n=1 Tax=Zychaea mexicana TaxID=64656 RepID=UPI0022FE5302|nr:uncharacterized protein BDB00DRAFT_878005 [Zychaea mexicana]KAI9485132.1 hypothetical protein BDB00DRAFT_878005 [Zychaea mexicana]
MSLNRSRARWSPPPPPPLPGSGSTGAGAGGGDIVPTSIEQSLQDWLSRSISDNSPILDTKCCRCCGLPNCDNFETLANTVRKLEGDARLAAGKEIGQSLLHKHENYVVESNQVKADLEQQLDEAREKARQLEQLLEDADCTRQELLEEHSKSTWEWQKTQKTLRETAADLEVANARCAQLINELKAETMEVDKLRIFKFMVRQADVREENLRAKLEDTKQELAIARKAELTLESKHRKLKSRYETVCSAYERLKLNQQEFGSTDSLTWLRESNEKLRRDVLKLTTRSSTSAVDLQHQQPHFITLIKELALANNKLKTDLLECRELLSETRHEVITLNCRIEDLEKDNNNNSSDYHNMNKQRHQWPDKHERFLSTSAPQDGMDDDDFNRMKWLQPSPPEPLQRKQLLQSQKSTGTNSGTSGSSKPGGGKSLRTRRATSSLVSPPKDLPAISPSPTASTSTPTANAATAITPTASIVHHHYHYHMQHQQQQHQESSAVVPRSYDSSQDDDDTLAPLQEAPSPRKIADNMQQQITASPEENSMLVLPPMKNSVSFSSQATSNNSVLAEDDATTAGAVILEEEQDGTPFHLLKAHVTQTLQRLRATDIRALNRRLKRAFDILELSTMSNSIIDNVLVDVEALRIRFAWLDDEERKAAVDEEEEPWRHDVSMQEFFPTLQVMQDMLQEIGQLRSTMNDLQVEYVKKVEESGMRAEQEVIRKREIRRAATTGPLSTSAATNQQPNIVAWLTSVFFQRPHPDVAADETKKLMRSVSHDSILEQQQQQQQQSNSERKTIRHKRSDIDRYGPPSSYPRVASSAEKRAANKPYSSGAVGSSSSSSTSQPRPIPYPKLRASRSAGGSVRRSRSMQAPALEYAAVKRKKSLGLNTSMVDLGTSPDIDVDWKVGSAFGATTSWLGNK